MTAIDVDHLRDWVGKRAVSEQVLDPYPARALVDFLDHERDPAVGDALPLPWHWLYFLDAPSRTETGIDGDPKRGAFLPPVPLPRRIWAARQLEVDAPLKVGLPARKALTVSSVELKEGRTGPLVFVTVDHELSQGDHFCIREVQNLVYREAPLAPAPLAPDVPALERAQWCRTVTPDPVLLFRFSALTYNAHCIHYDRDYANKQEFYPSLAVHGPLLATFLLNLLVSKRPDAAIKAFRFRAMRPAFDTDSIRLCDELADDRADLWTVDPLEMIGMRASAAITEAP